MSRSVAVRRSTMGNCCKGSNPYTNPGSVLDRVVSQGSSDDDCLLYKLADLKKGGELIDAYNTGGASEVEKLFRDQFGILMYKEGKGQIISRTEYLRWKFRNQKEVVIPVEATGPTDPLAKWEDHEACWQMQYRGSLGETLLHVLIMCDTKIHSRIARILLKCYPKLAMDVVEGEEYLGVSALHLAIAYSNSELTKMLVESGANVNQRAVGSFFLPKDQQRLRPSKNTDYEGLAYLGEYPLAWSACMANESAYNLLLETDANPDLQDSFGNMVLHMVVVTDQLGMFGYALRHPRVAARDGMLNNQGLTPLTLACKLGRDELFREMLELSCREYWRYSNVTCSGYPLNALDTIRPDGSTNWNSALFIILAGSKEEHLNMLDGGIIQRLLEEKWKTFVQGQFIKRITIALIHILCMSFAVYLRPKDRTKNLMEYEDTFDLFRLTLEGASVFGSFHYVVFQQGEEIKNQGFLTYLRQLPSSPPKTVFLIANFMLLSCIGFRLEGMLLWEEMFVAFTMVGSWFFMMFFAGAIQLTGPFVTMVYSMITGDMLTFGIIFVIILLGFSQAFFFLFKSYPATANPTLFDEYHTTWMGLYQMTLGSYDYSKLGDLTYPNMAKSVFISFMIMVPILLLNMLIAMMGNTYSQVIERSEKEWIKQWAKLVVALERSVTQEDCKKYINEYSIKIGGTDPSNEVRGVMVIKVKSKTRANQRKGALMNWKRVGKVTIQALKKRNMTGEEMRQLMWGHRNSICTPTAMTPMQQSMDFGDTSAIGKPSMLGNLDTALDQLTFCNDVVPVNAPPPSSTEVGNATSPVAHTAPLPATPSQAAVPTSTGSTLAPPPTLQPPPATPPPASPGSPATPTTSITATHVTPTIEKSPAPPKKQQQRKLKFGTRPESIIHTRSEDSDLEDFFDIMRRPPEFQVKSPMLKSSLITSLIDASNRGATTSGLPRSSSTSSTTDDEGAQMMPHKKKTSAGGGAVNFAFEPEEFADKAITKLATENMLNSGLILSPEPFLQAQEEPRSSKGSSSKRAKSAKAKRSPKPAERQSSTEALISDPNSGGDYSSTSSPPPSVPETTSKVVITGPPEDDVPGPTKKPKEAKTKKTTKKTQARAKSAKTSGNKVEPAAAHEEADPMEGKRNRPTTANDRWSTKDISNMNNLVAWDRPEDDI